MRHSHRAFTRAVLVSACLALAMAATSVAQGRGGGGPPPGGGPGGGMGGPPFPGSAPGGLSRPVPDAEPSVPREQTSDSRAGLEFGPPGVRWWDDSGYIKSLKLRPDQKTHMDAIFEQNRNGLVSRFDAVHLAETQMLELVKSPAPDEPALFAQIDRVAQARAELEKANTHMLLQLRKEMDADQIKRLEKQSPH